MQYRKALSRYCAANFEGTVWSFFAFVILILSDGLVRMNHFYRIIQLKILSFGKYVVLIEIDLVNYPRDRWRHSTYVAPSLFTNLTLLYTV